MNCQAFEKQLDDYVDSQLDAIEMARMSRHLETCVECHGRLETMRIVSSALAQLPDVTPPAGFAERVIERAVARAQRQRARQRNVRFAALAAALALCAIVVGYAPQLDKGALVEATVTLDEQIKVVRFAFDSTASVERARLTITLSDNLVIEGYAGQKTLSWNTSLKPGVNMLSLPVYAIAGGDGEIAASLEIGERQKQLVVKTRNPGASRQPAGNPRVSA